MIIRCARARLSPTVDHMLTAFSHLFAQADQHRKDLIADAERFRLSRVARAHRRSRSPAAPTPTGPPEHPAPAAPGPADPAAFAGRNQAADRRYAVSR